MENSGGSLSLLHLSIFLARFSSSEPPKPNSFKFYFDKNKNQLNITTSLLNNIIQKSYRKEC